MLAEYFRGFPTEIDCIFAVRTGKGAVAADFAALQDVSAASARQPATPNAALFRVIPLLLAQRLFELSLRAPERQQCLFVIVICTRNRSLLFEHIAQQYCLGFVLIADLAELLVSRLACGDGDIEGGAALRKFTELVVNVQ